MLQALHRATFHQWTQLARKDSAKKEKEKNTSALLKRSLRNKPFHTNLTSKKERKKSSQKVPPKLVPAGEKLGISLAKNLFSVELLEPAGRPDRVQKK